MSTNKLASFLMLILLALLSGPLVCPASAQERTFQAEWNQLISQAQKEGELQIIAGSGAMRERRKVFEFFGQKFGIKVVTTSGSGSKNATRILLERSRGLFTADVNMVSGTANNTLLDAKSLIPLRPLLIHPEVADRSHNWLTKEIDWLDDSKKYITTFMVSCRYNASIIFYNTDKVSQEEIDGVTSWYDFLKPRWRGRIAAVLDPDTTSYLEPKLLAWKYVGAQWFRRFITEAKPILLKEGNPRQLADALARGKYDVAIFAGQATNQIRQMPRMGLPVATLDRSLKEKLPIRFTGEVSVFDRAPHPKAAQLFVNWFLSREGQNTYHLLAEGTDPKPSQRTDVEQGKIGDERWSLARALDSKVFTPDRISFRKSDRKAFSEFIKGICREQGCYGQ